MNLGEVIAELEKHDPNKVVARGFHRPHSYRGFYERIAFEPIGPTTVGTMLESARLALGKRFEGRKGGTYLMDESTPVHIAARWDLDGKEDETAGLEPHELAAMLNSGPIDNQRPTPGFEKLTREEAVSQLSERMRRWKDGVRALPLAERLRVAADLIDAGGDDMRAAARSVVRHALDELNRGGA